MSAIVDRPLEQQPGAMQIVKRRELPSGHIVEFEHAPAGWLTKQGEPRKADWRAYHLTPVGGGKRRRVESVTTICDAILPKDGLAPWSERAGIAGAVEAVRRGLIAADTPDDQAVQIVRANRLGADAARDQAADRGLNAHEILERFMLTGQPPNPADHPERHRPFIRGLIRWLLKAEPEPVAVELLIADPERGYAGRLDLLAWIDGRLTLVDLKTQERGGIYESAHLQSRLYAQAEARWGTHEVQDVRVVVADGSGTYREMDCLVEPEVCEHALTFYRGIKGICAKCDSENRTMRKVIEARTLTVVREIPHGTVSGYNYHRCRCDECRRAKREYARGYDVRVDQRGEQKRRADANLKHPCESCGTLCSRRARVCRLCEQAARRAAMDERRREIQRRWLAGESLRQIGATLDSTPGSIATDLVRMRRAGWNVPQRGPRGKALA